MDGIHKTIRRFPATGIPPPHKKRREHRQADPMSTTTGVMAFQVCSDSPRHRQITICAFSCNRPRISMLERRNRGHTFSEVRENPSTVAGMIRYGS